MLQGMDRRRFLAGSLGLAGALALGACSDSDDAGGDGGRDGGPDGSGGGLPSDPDAVLTAPGSTGLVDEDTWQQRIDDFLAFSTTEPHLSSVSGIAAHLVAARRDPDHDWDPAAVTVDTLADTWEHIDGWNDTRDFTLMYLHWMWALGGGTEREAGEPAPEGAVLSDEVLDAVRERFVANRYRYDDPLPDDRIDNLWYWSENHRLITLAIEYLAGQELPAEVFEVTGLTGAEHLARSKGPILEWIDERARFGFFEWHSNVYLLKNIVPLLMLVELADDPEIVNAAALALDLSLVDLAAHTQKGSYAAPRGRTYKKDKMTSRHEDTFGTAKFLFDDTEADYPSQTDTGPIYLSAAQRYRPPQAVLEIAGSDETSVVRERHGIYFDGGSPVTDPVEAPYGFDFEDPANLPLWWSLGAVGMWPLAEVSVAEANEHRLWETELFAQITALADLNGRDPERIRDWLQQYHAIVNFGFLSEANTYAWRSPEVALATVVDHRFGEMRDQVHSWVAQVDSDALVFTNHPRAENPTSTDWNDDGSPNPGYWTGEASMPRSAQHERTAVHIYQPKWDETTDDLLWSVFAYQPFTHAFVPQERFDDVIQEGHWTVAAKDGGYIALWSWREPTWRTYDPATTATDGMTQPFDLVAEGGPDNVWIVEVGTDADGTLEDFVAAVTASDPEVERTDEGFTVAWESPSSGAITFGSTEPFTVEGEEEELADFPRHQSPWGEVDREETTVSLEAGGSTLVLDFDGRNRTVT